MIRWLVIIVMCGVSIIAKAGSEKSISVTDFSGHELVLAKSAKRIVALAPHIVENVYSAGAGQYLVAAVSYSDYPEAAKKLPIVGSYNSFSIEKIVSLKPDLVIGWRSGNGESVIAKLKALGVPVYIDEPRELEDIAESVKDIAILAGTMDKATESLDQFHTQLRKLRASSEKKSVRTFYQVWNLPLQTLSGEHIVSNVIELCGGSNIFHDAVSIAPKISVESVIQKDPQVIFASGMAESRPEWLDDWLKWSVISAVKNKHLYHIPPDYIQRHTFRILKGAELMCEYIEKASL